MILVNCPETKYPDPDLRWTFLAGGITNCWDWQTYVVNRLKNVPNLALFNPRRSNFDVTNPDEEHFQITWEFERLNACDSVLFWFPEETLCPITLFELGKWLGQKKDGIVIGCHPGYKRKNDVMIQTQLEKPGFVVYQNLDETIEEFEKRLTS